MLNQVQIIVGPGKAAKVATEINDILEKSTNDSNDSSDKEEYKKEYLKTKVEVRAKTSNVFTSFIRKISGIFVPLIPAFIACGVLLAIFSIIKDQNPEFVETEFGKIFNIVSSSVFTVLNVIVGYNAAKQFGGDAIIGAALAGVLTNPLLNEIKIGSLQFNSENGGVLATLLVTIFAAYFQKFLRKKLPDTIDTFLNPLITIVIFSAIGLFALQPLGGYINQGLAFLFEQISKYVPFLLGIIPLFYLLLVLTGTHHSLMIVSQTLIGKTGFTPIVPVQIMAGAAEVGAAIFVIMHTKNKKFKKNVVGALPIGFLGIDEPLIWGMSVQLKTPFIASGIGGFITGTFIACMGLVTNVPETTGVQASLLCFKDGHIMPWGFTIYLIGFFTSIILGFIFMALIGFDEASPNGDGTTIHYGYWDKVVKFFKKNKEVKNSNSNVKLELPNNNLIYAPLDGEIIPLEKVNDETFSNKILGDGIAIIPSSNKVYSPVDGVIASLIDSHHAYGITSDSGFELLIHVGLNTVNLKGEGFTCHVQEGQKVKKGDLLATFDAKTITEKGYNLVTPVILITDDIHSIESKTDKQKIKVGDELLILKKNDINKNEQNS